MPDDRKRFFVVTDGWIHDEFGLRIGSIDNARDPATRVLRFFDERLFTLPQSPHDVHFSDGKSQHFIGTWRMEKAVTSD